MSLRALSTDVCVLGAGIAGLTVRAALPDREVLCLDAAPRPGGLLQMHERGDFAFDTTVHVLFFRRPGMRNLVEALLTGGAHRFLKHNLVSQGGRQIDYPYQLNLGQLSEAARAECLRGLPAAPGEPTDPSFRAWLLAQFGEGLYARFFGPYNEKLYGVCPSTLVAAPMTWTIPADCRDEILRGAAPGAAPTAPSVECLYPRGRQGIEALPAAVLTLGEGPVLCGERVVSIDPAAREVTTESGLRVRYRTLVSTLPLPALLGCLDLPAPLTRAKESLVAAPVTVVHVGSHADGEALAAHWTYFPDREVPFYRMTRLERISPDVCPPGSAALLLECPGHAPPPREVVIDHLVRLGVLRSREIAAYGHVRIPHAYVLFRPGTAGALETARSWLGAREIETAGRYGDWRYANIEQTIESALSAAARVAGARQEDVHDRLVIAARALRPPEAADRHGPGAGGDPAVGARAGGGARRHGGGLGQAAVLSAAAQGLPG